MLAIDGNGGIPWMKFLTLRSHPFVFTHHSQFPIHFYPPPPTAPHNPRIALAGTRVMNRMSVEGTVPDRSRYGGAAG